MANAIENPALAQIDNPPLTGQPQAASSMPALATGGPVGSELGSPAGLHAQRQAVENPPLPPATGSVVQGVRAAHVPDFSMGRRLVPGTIPQIENPELD